MTQDPWAVFWERQQRAGAGGRSASGSGCLPNGWDGIAMRQRSVWHSFARRLPGDADILDLATGDGAVLLHLRDVSPAFTLTGVDSAAHLPPPPDGVVLHAGIAMEELPFADASFDAVTAQFGFEYGDVERAAREVARVLRPDGRVGMLTHRIDGPIVAHNRERREHIRWAIEEQDLLSAARASLPLRAEGGPVVPDAISKAPTHGADLHGAQSAAWEIAEAIRRTLALGKDDTPENVGQVLDEIEAQARNELGRIASLEAAAAIASDPDAIFTAMQAAGLAETGNAMVSDGNFPRPFANFRTFAPR